MPRAETEPLLGCRTPRHTPAHADEGNDDARPNQRRVSGRAAGAASVLLAAVGIVAYVAGSWEENPITEKPWGPPPPSRDVIREASRLLGQADAALASTSATRVSDAENLVLQAQKLDPTPEVLAAKDVVENMKRSDLSMCGCVDWARQNHPHLLGAQQLSSCSPGSDVMEDFTTLAKEMQRVQDVCCPADQVGKTCDVTNLACNDPACESAVIGFSQACYAQNAILNEGSPNADNELFDGVKSVLAAASKACGGRERTHEYYINDPTLSMNDPATGVEWTNYAPITSCAGTLNDASFSADRFECEEVKIQAPRNQAVELKVNYAHLVDQDIAAYDNPGCYAGGPEFPHGGPHGGCLTPELRKNPQRITSKTAVGEILRSQGEELVINLRGCTRGAKCRKSPALFSLEISCRCRDDTGCGGHGTCDTDTGQCVCNDGFYGQNCTKTQAPEPEPDPWRPTVDPPIHPPPSPPEPAPSPPPEPAPPPVQCPVTPGTGAVGEGYFGWQPAPGHVGDYAACCEAECTYERRGGQPFAHGKPFSCTMQQAEHSDSCVGKGDKWEFVAHSLGHDDKKDPWRCCKRF